MPAPAGCLFDEGPSRPLEPPAPRSARPVLRPMPTALWLAVMLYAAFYETQAELAVTLGGQLPARAINGAAVAALATRTFGHGLEAAFYAAWWRLRERRMGFAWMLCAVISLSVLDVLAGTLARIGAAGDQPWLAPLVGARAIPGLVHAWGGLGVAFGGVGLLSLARVLGTAYAQRQEGASWRGALAITTAAWMAGRLAIWWSADLLRGWSVTR